MPNRDIYVCKEGTILQFEGETIQLVKGVTRVRNGHPLLKAHPEAFELLTVQYEVTEDTSTRTRDTGRAASK